MAAPDSDTILQYLRSHFSQEVDGVTRIGSGMFSSAHMFSVGAQAYVIRISTHLEDFQKDEYAFRQFVSPALPIPRVDLIDEFDDTQFACVTRYCSGKTLKDNHNAHDAIAVPHLFDTLDAIHTIDVSYTRGWGLAGANGNGLFDSWAESLTALYNQKFDYDWAALARLPYFEPVLIEEFTQVMKRALAICPAERYLIHRDYGFDNVVVEGAQIIGVLDWAEFGYGDFLYDVAYLDFYSPEIRYGDLWLARAKAHGRSVPHFDERMRCYMLDIGLHGMAIAATLNNEREYVRTRERTQSVLLPSRRAPTDWTQ